MAKAEMTIQKLRCHTGLRRSACVVSFILLVFFCSRFGMSPLLAIVFFALYFIIATSLTRMRADLGPPIHAIVIVHLYFHYTNIQKRLETSFDL